MSRFARAIADRRILLLVPMALALGGYSAIVWAYFGAYSHFQVGTLEDGTTYSMEEHTRAWWFYPLRIGGAALFLAGVVLVPAHFILRSRRGTRA